MKTNLISTAVLIILFCAGCDQQDEPQVDLSAPVIEIIEPQLNDSFTAGQSVRVLVRIEENQELHDYSMIIRNEDLSHNQTLAGGHLHTTRHIIDELVALPDLNDQLYTITVKASDHNGNLGAAQIELYVP